MNDLEPMLSVSGLTRSFGGLIAVNNVSFAVNRQEIFGLIGPNGAGKTTLFNLISGLIPPSGGQLLFQGESIAKLRPHKIAKLGIARTFQNIRLFGTLSALENIVVARHIHTKSNVFNGVLSLPSAAKEEKIAVAKGLELLNLVGLGDRATEKACNFSYGDQRRLEIARALALNPKILLLDEPAAGMNTSEKQGLSEFIRQISTRFELTIVVIEHHVPLVMGLCDRIAVLNFGKLIALGNPYEVKTDPVVIEAYLGAET